MAGALLGNSVPDSVPLDFAVPLVFLVLLIPTLSHLHAVVAAAVGGLVTVVALELGVGPLVGDDRCRRRAWSRAPLVDSDDPVERASHR